MVQRIMQQIDGQIAAMTSVFVVPAWNPVADQPNEWRSKLQQEFPDKAHNRILRQGETWKTVYIAEAKARAAAKAAHKSGMYFVHSSPNTAHLQYHNYEKKATNFQVEYKTPKEAGIKYTGGSKKQADIITEGEHDNIHRYDWKKFKPEPEEEAPVMYVYSPTNADAPQRVR